MRIFDKTKTYELLPTQIDYEKGRLVEDKRFVMHHEAVQAQDEVYADRLEELPNGSTQIWKDLVKPAVEAKEAYDEYEDIQVYVPYTAAELEKIANDAHHKELKTELAKIKEDIEQEIFGLVRDDYAEKKARAAEIINELRILEDKEPRTIKKGVSPCNDFLTM